VSAAPPSDLAIEIIAAEELQDVVPRLEDLPLERLSAPDDVTNPLLRFARDADRRELAGAVEPRQLGGVIPIVFALHAGPLRNERWGDDVARIAPLLHRAVQNVAGAAGLIAGVELTVRRCALEPALEFERSLGSRSTRVGVFASPGRTAIVMDSLCTSIPR
jgi:hypothetical protein